MERQARKVNELLISLKEQPAKEERRCRHSSETTSESFLKLIGKYSTRMGMSEKILKKLREFLVPIDSAKREASAES